jgi:thioredoxin-related protein
MKRYLPLMILALSLTTGISCAGNKKTEKDEAKTVQAKAEWLAFDQAMEKAAADKKYVVVDFYTDWCKWCKVMDDKTYADSSVAAALKENFVIAKINGESSEKIIYQGKIMAQSDFTMNMKVSGFPSTLFMDSDGKVIGILPGYIEAPVYLKILSYITTKSYQKMKLDDYLAGKQ